MSKKGLINIIFLSFMCIATLSINFFNVKAIKSTRLENESLKIELQKIKNENASLTSENDELNKNHEDIKKKVNELSYISK